MQAGGWLLFRLRPKKGFSEMMLLRHAILISAVLCAAMTAWAHVEGGKVYCMDKDGSDVVRVSSGTGNVTGPTWNPDGSQILYVATGAGHGMHDYGDSRFHMVALPGLETRHIELPPGVLGVRSPAWKPDGTQVVFVGRSATSPDIGHNDLYLTNLADGTTANLTSGAVPLIGMPVWSPEGDRIAITTGIGEEWNLLVLEADWPERSRHSNEQEECLPQPVLVPGRNTVRSAMPGGGQLRDLCVERGTEADWST